MAVSDHMIVGRGISYQTLGSELAASGVDSDEHAMYLTKSQTCMVWTVPLIGEGVKTALDALDDPEQHARTIVEPSSSGQVTADS